MTTSLDTLYRKIPRMACRPGCGDCCGLVPWAPIEWAKVADRAPPGTELLDLLDDGSVVPALPGSVTCPFYKAGCTVYADRPYMCRLFGTAPDAHLTCPHGCRPTHRLTSEKAKHRTRQYIDIAQLDRTTCLQKSSPRMTGHRRPA